MVFPHIPRYLTPRTNINLMPAQAWVQCHRMSISFICTFLSHEIETFRELTARLFVFPEFTLLLLLLQLFHSVSIRMDWWCLGM